MPITPHTTHVLEVMSSATTWHPRDLSQHPLANIRVWSFLHHVLFYYHMFYYITPFIFHILVLRKVCAVHWQSQLSASGCPCHMSEEGQLLPIWVITPNGLGSKCSNSGVPPAFPLSTESSTSDLVVRQSMWVVGVTAGAGWCFPCKTHFETSFVIFKGSFPWKHKKCLCFKKVFPWENFLEITKHVSKWVFLGETQPSASSVYTFWDNG